MLSTPTRATVLRGRSPSTGTVVDAVSEHTDARVTIEFPTDASPSLAVGRSVNVAFYGGSAATGFDAAGRVVGRQDSHRGIRYELFFPRAANRALSPLVNRRGALRVRPDAEAPVYVQLNPHDRDLGVRVVAYDLSSSGVSVLVPPSFEQQLADVRSLELVVLLPGDRTERQIQGAVLRRELRGAQVLYGIQFDERGSKAEREAILQWVLARHRIELARGRKKPSEGREPPPA